MSPVTCIHIDFIEALFLLDGEAVDIIDHGNVELLSILSVVIWGERRRDNVSWIINEARPPLSILSDIGLCLAENQRYSDRTILARKRK